MYGKEDETRDLRRNPSELIDCFFYKVVVREDPDLGNKLRSLVTYSQGKNNRKVLMKFLGSLLPRLFIGQSVKRRPDVPTHEKAEDRTSSR